MAGSLLNRVRAFCHTPEPPDLGPGPRAHVEALARLEGRWNEQTREEGLPSSRAALIRAALLLWHDHLHAAHAVVQEIASADGSYLHALVHRREPDYANAKYWFRRVGAHPVFVPLADSARQIVAARADDGLLARPLASWGWDPFAFVEVCQELESRPASDLQRRQARELQRHEFEHLLGHLCA